MLMDNTLELLGITDSNINTTSRFSSNSRHSTETQKVSRSIASKFRPSFSLVCYCNKCIEFDGDKVRVNGFKLISDRIFP